MLPLPDAAFYGKNPKPHKGRGNFCRDTFQKGLRVPVDDFDTLSEEVKTALKEGVPGFGTPGLDLRRNDRRLAALTAVQPVIDRNNAKYGWDDIDKAILKDYIFELIKMVWFRVKRLKESGESQASSSHAAQSNILPSKLTSQPQSSQNLSLSPSASHSTVRSPSPGFPLFSSLRNPGHPLSNCTLLVKRINNNNIYEDTMDFFLKSASKGSSGSLGPNDYDFSILKSALVDELQYDEQSEVICYYHAQRGYIQVTHDSKWRIALQHMSSHTHSGTLNFQIAARNHIWDPTNSQSSPVTTQITLAPGKAADRGSSQPENVIEHISRPSAQDAQDNTVQPNLENPFEVGAQLQITQPRRTSDKILLGDDNEPQPRQNNLLEFQKTAAINDTSESRLLQIHPHADSFQDSIMRDDDEAIDNQSQGSYTIPVEDGPPETTSATEHGLENTPQPSTPNRTALATRGKRKPGQDDFEFEVREPARKRLIEDISPDITPQSQSVEDTTNGEDGREGGPCANEPVDHMTEEEKESMSLKLQSCPSLTQMTPDQWDSCCRLFNHDPRKVERSDLFQIPGLTVGLFPHQAFAVYWMIMQQVLRINGAFLADDMGVGKTLEFLAVWVLQRNIRVAWDNVKESRESADPAERDKHLQDNQVEGAQCPSGPSYIQCPCQNNSIAHRLARSIQQGPVLLLAPGMNISVWEKECEARIDRANIQLGLQWHIAYSKSKLSGDIIAEIQCDINTLKAKPGQDKHLVISSNDSFVRRVLHACLQPRKNSHRRNEPETNHTCRHPITWSIMGRDESHRHKNVGTRVIEYFKLAQVYTTAADGEIPTKPWNPGDPIPPGAYKARHRGRPLKIAISGTPFEGSPLDLLGHFQSFERNKWASPEYSLRNVNTAELKKLSTEHLGLAKALQDIRTPEADKEIQVNIRSYTQRQNAFLRHIMIRRTRDDTFFNYTIIPINAMAVDRIPCTTAQVYVESIAFVAKQAEEDIKREYAQRLKNWMKMKGPKPLRPHIQDNLHQQVNKSSSMYFLRLAGDFPAIPMLHNEAPDWTFHADEVHAISWHDKNIANRYTANLRTLVNSSDKLQKLDKILADMRERSNQYLAKGEMKEKMILSTAHPSVVGILWLYFREYKKDWNVTMISAQMTPDKRNGIIDDFCRDEKENPSSGSDILLTSTICVSTGLNITAANVFVMFDPVWMKKDQDQAFARVHRTGQERTTYLYLLYNIGNPIERDIISRQDARGSLGALTWQVTTGEAEEELLRQQREAESKARARARQDIV